MTTDNVWQLLLRRGPASDLPGTPTAPGQPPTTGLAEGELGMTTDTGRLFLGVNPQQGMPNYNRSAFPYNNVEVLTENSPLTTLFGVAFSDNQLAFYQSLPLQETASFVSLTMTSLADGRPTIMSSSGRRSNWVASVGNISRCNTSIRPVIRQPCSSAWIARAACLSMAVARPA